MYFLFFYYIATVIQDVKWSLWPAILFFSLCFLAIGRGGILTSSFLLITLSFYRLKHVRNIYKKYTYIFMAAIFAVLLCAYALSTATDISDLFPRFQTKGAIDNSRLIIWTSYLINNLQSVHEFLFSSDIQKIVARFEGNLHNSLLQCYASFGLFVFIIIIGCIYMSLIYGIRNKEYIWSILFLTLILRSLTDRVFFQGYCEIYLYYFILAWKTRFISSRRVVYAK